jgi:class 3 adenylate cyclase
MGVRFAHGTAQAEAGGNYRAIEKLIHRRSEGVQEGFRAGIHNGECEVIDGKVGGLAVSIGARVASNAGPSEVLMSQTVRDLVAGVETPTCLSQGLIEHAPRRLRDPLGARLKASQTRRVFQTCDRSDVCKEAY